MSNAVAIRKSSSIFNELKEIESQIMRRAFEIFEQNGSRPGHDFRDWTQAERELMWSPAFELCEKDGKFQLEVALPGVDAKDLRIEATPEYIVLKAEIQHQHTEQKGLVHHCDFDTGSLFRAIRLPARIDPDRVRAELRNGLLRLTAEIAIDARPKRIKPEAA